MDKRVRKCFLRNVTILKFYFVCDICLSVTSNDYILISSVAGGL